MPWRRRSLLPPATPPHYATPHVASHSCAISASLTALALGIAAPRFEMFASALTLYCLAANAFLFSFLRGAAPSRARRRRSISQSSLSSESFAVRVILDNTRSATRRRGFPWPEGKVCGKCIIVFPGPETCQEHDALPPLSPGVPPRPTRLVRGGAPPILCLTMYHCNKNKEK